MTRESHRIVMATAILVLSGVLAILWIVSIVLAVLSSPAHAAWDGEPATSAWHEWFGRQVTPDGQGLSCCNEADGHVLEDAQVRVVAGDYEVATESGWMKFPNRGQGQPGNTVLGAAASGNPTGHAVAWWMGARAYCFAEGAGT